MSVAQCVAERFTLERDSGKTYQAIADKYSIDQSYAYNLLNERRSYDGITLGILDRMFPNAKIDLDGHAPIVASRVASPGDGDISYAVGDRSEQLRAAIIAAIIDLDIPDNILAKVLKTIKHTEAKS